MSRLTRRMAKSPLATPLGFAVRLVSVLRHLIGEFRGSLRWLIASREHTNFTYELTDRNVAHLAHWTADFVGTSPAKVQQLFDELLADGDLREHLLERLAASDRWRLHDADVRYGRRMAWYAITRVVRPRLVVETGTDKGLGTCVIAAALLRNGHGRITTIDVNPDSGLLLGGRYLQVIERRLGDSVSTIMMSQEPIDIFLHDSLHTYDHESAELAAATQRMDRHAIVLSDNAHDSDALLDWAQEHHRRFGFFREVPKDHPWPGDGIGIAIAHDWLPTEHGGLR